MTTQQELLDHELIAQRYFFPRPDAPPHIHWIDVSQDIRLACYKATPHGAGAKTLLHFHGNGECVADYVPSLVELFTALGVNVVLAEYRGYGASTGSPALASMLDDAVAVVRALDTPAERIVIMGRSVGSLYALHAASQTPRIAGLIIESGIADVHERIAIRVRPEELGVSAEALESALKAQFDHRAKMASLTAPVLILHAEHDHLVSVSHAHRLAAWCSSTCTSHLFERGDHNSIMFANLQAYLGAMRAFLDG